MQTRASHVLIASVAAIGLGACAGAPASRPDAPTAAATAAPTTAPLRAPSAVPDAEDADNPFPGTHMRKARNGETLYCRRDEVAGTRIPQLVCATEAVMRNREAESRRMIDEARTTSVLGGCNPSTGC